MIIAAHPDDEVLGCGGTMARHSNEGDTVYTVFMADGVTSRGRQLKNDVLQVRNKAATEVSILLGSQLPLFFGFPDNKMDTIAFLDIVQTLEPVIQRIQPSIVYTHHGGDLNIDHQITHRAVMTACRPIPGQCVKEIYCFEVLSSTEWSSSSVGNTFIPKRFVDISSSYGKKISALEIYGEEIHRFPHSRSKEAIKALAELRGSSMGIKAAEGFGIERQIL